MPGHCDCTVYIPPHSGICTKIVRLTSFHSFMFEICSLLSPHQDTPLHMAARSGDTDTVQCLIEKGAGINIKNYDGVSE